MKKTLLIILTLAINGMVLAQTLNQPANWPNTNWILTGVYDATYLDADPTSDNSFSFNDDAPGSASDNTIAAESPVINLTNAFSASETEIVVSFSYNYNIYQGGQDLFVQYWDADSSTWQNWQTSLAANSGAQNNFCTFSGGNFISESLNISGFSSNQLQNFRYRIFYNDNTTWGWGFCVTSPTINSIMPPACPNVANLGISNVNSNSALANWNAGGSESTWEVSVRLATDGSPSSGTEVSSTSFSMTGLTQETDYVFYVRAVCVGNGFSNWESRGFTTGTDLSGYPTTFTSNSISAPQQYDIALVDLNGDFLDDVVSVGSTTINVNYQLPGGGFNNVNITTTPADYLPTWSLAAGDFDANGYNDLVYGATNGVTFMKANNDGTGYTEISGPEDVFSQRSNFVDINNDGHLDAFVCHDVEANVYYINDGSGNLNFYQGRSPGVVPNGLGLTPGGGNYGTVWIDFDNDRDMDLFIAKCRGGSTTISTNELWRNDGNGVFVNVADSNGWYNTNYPSDGHNNSSNLGDNVQTWSSAWADFDNDGDMDVFVGASSTSNGNSKLMRNNGDGTFTDVTAASGVLDAQLGIENAPADFDNDGFVDIMSNGDVLFNNGNFTFTNYPNNMPPTGAIGDANNDGFLDVFRSGTLYINNTNSNNWIKINTIGTDSNINGIGARVVLNTPSGTQIRDVRSGEGFEYMSSLNTHFGLGTETTITDITIYWPSGNVDVISGPGINTTVSVIEGSTLSILDEELVDAVIYPNPVEDVLTITTSAQLTGRIATVFDLNGKRVLNQKLETDVLNVSNLQEGIYFLRIESNGKSIKRKFIKK
ncbi:VCBS repeat-containing protein [Winogradskyella sp. DF17]|uniref:VCBS repeat-containing protein n=1 Tax=Winogradskyella pelagia TaxID=2819984 RepID=A0ABS3SYL8_9FLAO|nr:FG-GAP-like repeat-containing protein [Winogradskyella sp. DF17]MBO3115309.1 VCBS repeat-containing protein [Winogradskyella sp. DF17]